MSNLNEFDVACICVAAGLLVGAIIITCWWGKFINDLEKDDIHD